MKTKRFYVFLKENRRESKESEYKLSLNRWEYVHI